jgi:hypothetical protein
MNLFTLLQLLSPLPLLILFGKSLDEGILLGFASLLFFGLLFSRVQNLGTQFFQSRREEIYLSLLELLELRLQRLFLLLNFGRRLAALSLLFAFPAVSSLFVLLSALKSLDPVPPLLLASSRRLRKTFTSLEEQEQKFQKTVLNLSFGQQLSLIEETLRLRAAIEHS